MAHFTAKVDMNNAAFEENPEELSDILRRIADNVADGCTSGYPRDLNGNSVGYWEIVKDEAPSGLDEDDLRDIDQGR